MALTRKMLSAMGIEDEKIEQIISAHTETVTGLKDKIEGLEDDAKKLPKVQKELEELKAQVKEREDADNPLQKDLEKLQKKYDDLKKEHDDYKAEITGKEIRKAKEEAYMEILKDAGIPKKHFAKILKYSDVDGVELGDDGKIKTAADILKSVKEEWGDHVEKTEVRGMETTTPPANEGGSTTGISRARQLAQKFAAERYGAPAAAEKKEG